MLHIYIGNALYFYKLLDAEKAFVKADALIWEWFSLSVSLCATFKRSMEISVVPGPPAQYNHITAQTLQAVYLRYCDVFFSDHKTCISLILQDIFSSLCATFKRSMDNSVLLAG